MGVRGERIWRDRTTHETKGGWWFEYRGADNEMTQDGPFETYDLAEAAMGMELEDLVIELEGEL